MGIKEDLVSCIPVAFIKEIEHIVRLPWTSELDTSYYEKKFKLKYFINSERLQMPDRVYYTPFSNNTLESIPAIQRLIIAALFSRHHNGHLREQSLDLLLTEPLPWVLPFIIQLSAEYILEINLKIAKSLDMLPKKAIGNFFKENPGYLDFTRQRMVSYWNCYDKINPEYKLFINHPAHKVLYFYENNIALRD